jgi:glucosamine--fructose-6-phosphate aminotransferase (isomerizing)
MTDATSRGMRAEIAEQPAVLERCLRDSAPQVAEAVALIRAARPELIVIAARGSSAYAGMYLRSLAAAHLGVPVIGGAPSVHTVYGRSMTWPHAVLVAISQSGQGPDVLSVVQDAVGAGIPSIAICNDPASPLARATDVVIPCRAGPEAITATKSYLAEVALCAAVVAGWSGSAVLRSGLDRAPAAVAATVSAAASWLDAGAGAGLVDALSTADRALVVSRGHDLATAFEVALKIAETGGLLASGMSAADFLHGFVVLATPGTPFLAIRPDGAAGPSVDRAREGAARHGASQWLIGGPEVAGIGGALSVGSDLPTDLSPLVFPVPGQLAAEAAARRRGRDPDRPDGLVKVIRTY